MLKNELYKSITGNLIIALAIVFSQNIIANSEIENQCKEIETVSVESIPSVSRDRRLIVGEEKSFEILADRRMNYSGIYLEEGSYSFEYSNLDNWCDASIHADVDGWFVQTDFLNKILSWTHWVSRFPSGKLYTLVGGIHNQWGSQFNMGVLMKKKGKQFITQDQEGELYAFANDLYFMYFNNHGRVIVTVKRLD